MLIERKNREGQDIKLHKRNKKRENDKQEIDISAFSTLMKKMLLCACVSACVRVT